MSAAASQKWQSLVDSFSLHKPGVNPWDANELDEQFDGASHGEKCTIQFLLNLWNGSYDWKCGQFDLFDAFATWNETQRTAFLNWATNPWWP